MPAESGGGHAKALYWQPVATAAILPMSPAGTSAFTRASPATMEPDIATADGTIVILLIPLEA